MTDSEHPTDPSPPPSRGVVPMIATPTDELSLAAILRDSFTHVMGEPPTSQCLACGWAMICLENAHGRVIWNHNYGNIMATHAWSGDYYVEHVKERVQRDPDVWKEFDAHFRAHDDHLAGAADYWHLLATQYAPALALFEQGKPSEAAFKLSAMRYYTAHAEIYAATMTSLFGSFMKHILPLL